MLAGLHNPLIGGSAEAASQQHDDDTARAHHVGAAGGGLQVDQRLLRGLLAQLRVAARAWVITCRSVKTSSIVAATKPSPATRAASTRANAEV